MGARNYQLESRHERPIYWREPFAVRWVFEAIPPALVGNTYTSKGYRAYAYGVGASPIGAQINFFHYRHVEPFLTSGGGFPYFNHRIFGTALQFNFTAQPGGGCRFSPPAAAPPLILDISITTFRTRIWEIKIPGWTRICCSSACRYFGREATVETPKRRSRGLA